MEMPTRARIQSQLGNAPCEVEDTEEMFWLRESDDYQSKVSLGNLLARQYRFKEASAAYRSAAEIRSDDWMLFYRLGGAELTSGRFDAAMDAYQAASSLGAPEKTISYPLGFWHYLRGDFQKAARLFEGCLPCGGEMMIAVIYWHTLCCLRGGMEPALLGRYSPAMDVGHHTAYRRAVSVFCGETAPEEMLLTLRDARDDLGYVITLYGILRYLDSTGTPVQELLDDLLDHDRFWPCLSYLAAWQDHLSPGTDLLPRSGA